MHTSENAIEIGDKEAIVCAFRQSEVGGLPSHRTLGAGRVVLRDRHDLGLPDASLGAPDGGV